MINMSQLWRGNGFFNSFRDLSLGAGLFPFLGSELYYSDGLGDYLDERNTLHPNKVKGIISPAKNKFAIINLPNVGFEFFKDDYGDYGDIVNVFDSTGEERMIWDRGYLNDGRISIEDSLSKGDVQPGVIEYRALMMHDYSSGRMTIGDLFLERNDVNKRKQDAKEEPLIKFPGLFNPEPEFA